MHMLKTVLVIATLLVPYSVVQAQNNNVFGKETRFIGWKGATFEVVDCEQSMCIEQNSNTLIISNRITEQGFSVKTEFDFLGWGTVQIQNNSDMLKTIENLKSIPGVKVVEPNFVERTQDLPDDPYFDDGTQWHISTINADDSWDEYGWGDSDIKIGVLDSGIPMAYVPGHPLEWVPCHPELDDVTHIMWELGDVDLNGHGTHVCGIVAAETDNSTGIAGVAGNSRLYSYKVFDDQGHGSAESFYQGVLACVYSNCDIINYSGGGPASDRKLEAIQYARQNGVLLVASAGNADDDQPVDELVWPAAYANDYDNVISVGATTSINTRAYWSCYGPELRLAAPGSHIWSTTPNYSFYMGTVYGYSQNYDHMSGTSMAAPVVAGVAALVKSHWPTKSAAEIRTILEKSAVDRGSAGWDQYYGYGIVNAFYAIAPPEVPENYSGTIVSGHPRLIWDASEAPDLVRYRIKRRNADGTIDDDITTTNTYYVDNETPVGVGDATVRYAVRSEDYTELNSSYTGWVSFKTYGGIFAMSEGNGLSISALPEEFTVDAPSPNPFNAATTIRFGLPEAGHVKFDVYDIMGRHVMTLMDEERPMGWHTLSWNAGDAASGTYFLVGRVGSEIVNRKLTVVK